MKKYAIIHGHFYQPPREDPWSGLIGKQDSAEPYANWNIRITAESYAACGASRVLDGGGAIRSIINIYEYISFNFGPTLLSWLESESPNVYRRILDADRTSRERLGHGNAMAQAFNHTILPLDRPVDARTQVRWGLQDFQRRFGRPAEGLWLPECAVNLDVVDILIAEGVEFIVLSPWQARAVESNQGVMKELTDRPAPSDRPFLIDRPGGRMAAFFYDPQLASDISFGHLLRSREGLTAALEAAWSRNKGPLVNVATDGEIYGHHEPYGDMCLSSYIDRIPEDSSIQFTNYAAYLARHAPRQGVELRDGSDGRGSSWSCFHGVDRWQKDCGCSTGGEQGWNQAWRKPLRGAFDALRDRAEPLWSHTVSRLTGQPARDVLESYGAVAAGARAALEFAEDLLGSEADPADLQSLLEALEGAKFLQFMYTSCGWFFAEISGIEPVQNMRYAYRAAELLDPTGSAGLIEVLRTKLAKARSNIVSMGSGAEILQGMVVPRIDPNLQAAGIFFWRRLYNLPGADRSHWGNWRGTGIRQRTVGTDGRRLTVEGDIEYTVVPIGHNRRQEFRATIDGDLFCPQIEVASSGTWQTIAIGTMPSALRTEIRSSLLHKSEERLKKFLGSQVLDRLRDHDVVDALNLPFGTAGWQSLELSLHYGPLLVLDRLERSAPDAWPKSLDLMERILDQRALIGMDVDAGSLENRSGRLISKVAETLQDHCERTMLEVLVRLLEILHKHGLRPVRPLVQNTVYGLLQGRLEERNGSAEVCAPSDRDLWDLARLLNINPEDFLPDDAAS